MGRKILDDTVEHSLMLVDQPKPDWSRLKRHWTGVLDLGVEEELGKRKCVVYPYLSKNHKQFLSIKRSNVFILNLLDTLDLVAIRSSSKNLVKINIDNLLQIVLKLGLRHSMVD
jgi:hypothetical protein